MSSRQPREAAVKAERKNKQYFKDTAAFLAGAEVQHDRTDDEESMLGDEVLDNVLHEFDRVNISQPSSSVHTTPPRSHVHSPPPSRSGSQHRPPSSDVSSGPGHPRTSRRSEPAGKRPTTGRIAKSKRNSTSSAKAPQSTTSEDNDSAVSASNEKKLKAWQSHMNVLWLPVAENNGHRQPSHPVNHGSSTAREAPAGRAIAATARPNPSVPRPVVFPQSEPKEYAKYQIDSGKSEGAKSIYKGWIVTRKAPQTHEDQMAEIAAGAKLPKRGSKQ